METKEVKTSIGTFTLKAPTAGVRNKALVKAETRDGFKATIFLMELMPTCVAKRPIEIDQDVPIGQVLDGLECPDYDILSVALKSFLEEMKDGLSEEKIEQKKD